MKEQHLALPAASSGENDEVIHRFLLRAVSVLLQPSSRKNTRIFPTGVRSPKTLASSELNAEQSAQLAEVFAEEMSKTAG